MEKEVKMFYRIAYNIVTFVVLAGFVYAVGFVANKLVGA